MTAGRAACAQDGAVPPPRMQHGVAAADGYLYAFAGRRENGERARRAAALARTGPTRIYGAAAAAARPSRSLS